MRPLRRTEPDQARRRPLRNAHRLLFSLLLILFLVGASAAQNSHGVVLVPDSTVEHAQDIGHRAHTNHLIMLRPHFTGTSPSGETPQTIYPVYLGTSFNTNGGSQTIAIVDAYDYPTAASDLNTFSSQFGLPAMPDCSTNNNTAPCFSKVYASGSKPRANCGWGQEAALDIEWAHAMAPQARIILVEAASNSFTNLFSAVDVATAQVRQNGKGEVSMSWGGSEFTSEANYDFHFSGSGTSNVVYFGSSGDTGGVTIYPSASPFVVAAGGTALNRNKDGSFKSETGWSGSGGGPSKYEPKPSYQAGIAGTDSNQRSIPDFSFDADPSTGVSVYDSTRCQGLSGWLVFGGTSVSSPSLAGIVNRAGNFHSSSTDELTTMYSSPANWYTGGYFYDVTSGTAGSFSAGTGWDFVTGIGSSRGTGQK